VARALLSLGDMLFQRLSGCALSLLLMAAGCGDDAAADDDGDDAAPGDPDAAGDGPDAGDDEPDGGGGDPAFRTDFVGQILLLELGDFDTGSVFAFVNDGPELMPVELVDTAGDCSFYRRTMAVKCDAPCDGICPEADECLPYPQSVSAGTIEVTGLAQELAFQRMEGYYLPVPDVTGDLFEAGAEITATAAGDAVQAFSVAATGVAPLEADRVTLELEDDVDEIVTWTAAASGRIQLALRTGWHGAPYETQLLCETDDDGSLTIPGELITQMPPFGGVGLFPHPSTLSRFSRGVAETSVGPVELFATSQLYIDFTHNYDE
jgi:hypothetical protein